MISIRTNFLFVCLRGERIIINSLAYKKAGLVLMLKNAVGKEGNIHSQDKATKASARAARKAAIAEFIGNYLSEGGHTKEWLAEKSDIDPATLYRILNKEVLPTESTIRALAGKVGEGLLLVAGYPGLAPSIDAIKRLGLM